MQFAPNLEWLQLCDDKLFLSDEKCCKYVIKLSEMGDKSDKTGYSALFNFHLCKFLIFQL